MTRLAERSLVLVAAAAELAVSLEDARRFCEVAEGDSSPDGLLRDLLIPAAIEASQEYTGRQWVNATYDLTLDRFPRQGSGPCAPRRPAIVVPRSPLVSVTYLKHVDEAGVLQTVDAADYKALTAKMPGQVEPAFGKTWPAERDEGDAVTLRFVAGHGADASSVPYRARLGMLQAIATWFAHRERFVTGTIATTLPERAMDTLSPLCLRGFPELEEE